jgi:hypothetical protein
VNLYKFCQENCIAGTSGALIEVKRCEFQLVGEIDLQLLQRLRFACIEAGGQYGERSFHFKETSQADGFAEAANGMGVEAHTLKKHVEALSFYLQAVEERLKLPPKCAEERGPETPIMVLDPITRRWKPSRLDEVDRLGGAVLRNHSGFYIAHHGTVAKASKEEAYLFALLFLYREKSVTVIMDESGSFVGVKLNDVGNLPESVFYTLIRFQPALHKGSRVMMFYRADADAVFRALRLAKVNPVVATDIVRLAQKLGGKEVPVFSPRTAPKEAGLLSEVLCDLGYSVKQGDQYLQVELEEGPIRIYLTSSGRYLSSYLSDGTKTILIPLRYLLTPDGALYAFKMVRTYGFSLIAAEQWERVLRKLCELAEGEPSESSKLVTEALLMGRSRPEILNSIHSNSALKKAATDIISLAAQGMSSTPLDKLPQGELIELYRRLRHGP